MNGSSRQKNDRWDNECASTQPALGSAEGLELLVAVVNKMFKLLKMKRSSLLHFYGAKGERERKHSSRRGAFALLVYVIGKRAFGRWKLEPLHARKSCRLTKAFFLVHGYSLASYFFLFFF